MKKIMVILITTFMLITPAIASQTPANVEIKTITCSTEFYERNSVLNKTFWELKEYVFESAAHANELSKLDPEDKKAIEILVGELKSAISTINRMAMKIITSAVVVEFDAKTAGCNKMAAVAESIKSHTKKILDTVSE